MNALQAKGKATRTALIVGALRKCGAATVPDIAQECSLSRELVRRYINELTDAGTVVQIEPANTHVRVAYGLAKLDDAPEYDQHREVTDAWPRGQHGRDFLVSALFGATSREVRA